MTAKTVVTFRADDAEQRIQRFQAWGGGDVEDLGTLDGHRRYRVPASRWSAYTRAASSRPGPGLLRLFQCGDCKVTCAAGALANHQKASGHGGRSEA